MVVWLECWLVKFRTACICENGMRYSNFFNRIHTLGGLVCFVAKTRHQFSWQSVQGLFRGILALGASASLLALYVAHSRRKNQQLKTFTHTLQVFLTALRLHTTLISLPVSLNHKVFLIRFLWLDLTRALTQQVNQATHSTSPHIIKGLFLCLVHTTSQIFTGAYAIHTLFSTHSLRLPSHESTSSVVIKFLAHLKSAAAAAFQTQTFSHVSCLIYHTTSLRKLFHVC